MLLILCYISEIVNLILLVTSASVQKQVICRIFLGLKEGY